MTITTTIGWNEAYLTLEGDYTPACDGDSGLFELDTVYFDGLDVTTLFSPDDHKRMEQLAVASLERDYADAETEAAIDAYEALRSAA